MIKFKVSNVGNPMHQGYQGGCSHKGGYIFQAGQNQTEAIRGCLCPGCMGHACLLCTVHKQKRSLAQMYQQLMDWSMTDQTTDYLWLVYSLHCLSRGSLKNGSLWIVLSWWYLVMYSTCFTINCSRSTEPICLKLRK